MIKKFPAGTRLIWVYVILATSVLNPVSLGAIKYKLKKKNEQNWMFLTKNHCESFEIQDNEMAFHNERKSYTLHERKKLQLWLWLKI